MKKPLVMMLMAMSLAAIAPAITASPASAAQARCTVGVTGEPWWWANENALERTGEDRVLAIRLPAVENSDAILWTYSGNENQKWRHKCVGYDSLTGRNNWQLRYAPNTSLCLTTGGVGFVVLSACSSESSQIWQRVERGPYTALRQPAANWCLQPTGGGTANGTHIVAETCNYSAVQLWF